MPTVGTHPLDELRSWLRASATRYRQLRLFMPKARTEVACDIAADAIASSNATATAAHRAATFNHEAARLMAAAQRPGSPGGAAITPAEGAPIVRLITRSAEIAHDIAEQNTISAP